MRRLHIPTEVRIEHRECGVDLSGTYGPGVMRVADDVAALLIAAGAATPATKTKPEPESESGE